MTKQTTIVVIGVLRVKLWKKKSPAFKHKNVTLGTFLDAFTHGFCRWAILTVSKQNHADIAEMIQILLPLVTKGLRGHWVQSQTTLFPKYCIIRLFCCFQNIVLEAFFVSKSSILYYM